MAAPLDSIELKPSITLFINHLACFCVTKKPHWHTGATSTCTYDVLVAWRTNYYVSRSYQLGSGMLQAPNSDFPGKRNAS